MNTLAGTGTLIRIAVRRDRITLPGWLLGLAAFTAGTTAMSVDGFPTTADLVRDTEFMASNPAMRLLGLASGASVGGFTMIRDFLTLAVLAALMSTFAVMRHTRQNEETGRAELTGATVVGRHASLAAALIVTVAANVALAVLIALAMIVNGQPAAGSGTAGAAVASVGVVFAGIAAITAQLTTSSRSASGLAAAVLGVAFLTSGIGNMTGHVDATGLRVHSAWPAWLSPIGWGQQMRPFGGDNWWPLGLAVALFLACVAVAAVLVTRRDLGHGLLPQRRGRGAAGRGLRSALGLAWRLQRGALLGWAAGMIGFGLVFGGIIGSAQDLTGPARDWYTRMGGTEQILDAYRTSIIEMAGMAVAIYVVQVLLRMRAEEADGPLEPVLAAAVGRVRWVAGHAVAATLGATGLLLLFAVAMGLVAGAVLDDPAAQVAVLLGAAVAQLPAVGVIGAVVVTAIGLLPRLAGPVSWAALVASILLGPLFAVTLDLPRWAQNLSPFTHLPKAPAESVTAVPVLALIATAALLALAGLVSLRRRDLALPA